MDREPLHSLPKTVASGPRESLRRHRFEVVLQTSSADKAIVLRATGSPNAATIAFHEELRRLTTQGITGELVIVRHAGADTPILRQPLECRSRVPTRIRQ